MLRPHFQRPAVNGSPGGVTAPSSWPRHSGDASEMDVDWFLDSGQPWSSGASRHRSTVRPRVTIDEARDEVVIRPSALERWFGSPARSGVSVNGPRSGPEFLCFARSDVIAVQRCNRLLRGTELVEEQVNLVVRNEDSQLYRVLISQQYEAKWIDALARSYAQYLNCLVLDHREVLPSK